MFSFQNNAIDAATYITNLLNQCVPLCMLSWYQTSIQSNLIALVPNISFPYQYHAFSNSLQDLPHE